MQHLRTVVSSHAVARDGNDGRDSIPAAAADQQDAHSWRTGSRGVCRRTAAREQTEQTVFASALCPLLAFFLRSICIDLHAPLPTTAPSSSLCSTDRRRESASCCGLRLRQSVCSGTRGALSPASETRHTLMPPCMLCGLRGVAASMHTTTPGRSPRCASYVSASVWSGARHKEPALPLQVARLRDAKDSAKDSIREMGSVRAARLRSAYHSLRQRGLQAVGSRAEFPEAEVLGHDGLLRVGASARCGHSGFRRCSRIWQPALVNLATRKGTAPTYAMAVAGDGAGQRGGCIEAVHAGALSHHRGGACSIGCCPGESVVPKVAHGIASSFTAMPEGQQVAGFGKCKGQMRIFMCRRARRGSR